MKKILIGVLLIAGLAFQKAGAQARFSVHLNFGSQPHYAYGYSGYRHAYYAPTYYRTVYRPVYRVERVRYYRPVRVYHRYTYSSYRGWGRSHYRRCR